MNPYVKSIEAWDNNKKALVNVFEDQRLFNLKPNIKLSVFARLEKHALFQTARVVSGSVKWIGEVGLSYDMLHFKSKPTQPTEKFNPL
jgi:hypothetical protein